jgi:membrane protein implicated in regulation of membrane protease activity
MFAMIHLLAGDENAQAARWIRDVMTSWPAQGMILALYAGLAILAFTRVARDWDDGPRKRYFRAAIVALGLFFVLEFILGKTVLDVVLWPTWLFVIECVWLFALWLYYFIRFMTGRRRGPGDDETRRRGAALEGVIAPLSDEAHHTSGA